MPKKSTGTRTRHTKPTKKPKTKKPKVTLAKNKVILLSALISGICVLSLALSIILSKGAKTNPRESLQEQKTIVQTEKPAQSSQAPKTGVQKKQTMVQAQPVKSGSQQKEVKKSEGKKESSPKNTIQTQAVNQKISEKNPSNIKIITKAKKEASVVKVIPQNQTSQAGTARSSSGKDSKTAASPQKIQSNQNSQIASHRPTKEQEQIQQNVPRNRFDIPPASNGATVVIIIDDAGRSVENTKRYAALPFPITIAVLPKLSQSRACADAIRAAGKEVILHQPMQSNNLNLDPGPGKITADMSTYEIAAIVKQNLLELGPGVKGMNNHEGSQVTSNVIKIGTVLDVCSEMGVYFLDSRTTAATQAPQAALERDMHIFEKAGPYLDNDIDRAKMLERMRETLAYANRHGRAIVIGHVDKSVKILPDLLSEMYPEMKAAGYRFATPSMLR